MNNTILQIGDLIRRCSEGEEVEGIVGGFKKDGTIIIASEMKTQKDE